MTPLNSRIFSTAVDFQRGETAAELEAALSLRVLQLLTLGVRLLVKLSQQDKTAKNAQKEAVQHGKQQDGPLKIEFYFRLNSSCADVR